MYIGRNKFIECGTGISLPETFTGKIEENEFYKTKIGIEIRNKEVASLNSFIDTIDDLTHEEKTKLKEITNELNSVDEEPKTLMTKAKGKITEYALEIEKQWLIPLIIVKMDKLISLIPHITP